MTEDPRRNDLSAYKIEQLERAIAELRESNTILSAEIRATERAWKEEIRLMKEAEAQKEKHMLMVGVTTLGGIVVTLFGVLWTYRSVIFK